MTFPLRNAHDRGVDAIAAEMTRLQAESAQWQKALVLALHQLGIVKMRIDNTTIQAMIDRPASEQLSVVMEQREDGTYVELMTNKEFADATPVIAGVN